MGVAAGVKPWGSHTARCGAPSSTSRLASRGWPDLWVREGLFFVALGSSGTADVGGIGLCSLTTKTKCICGVLAQSHVLQTSPWQCAGPGQFLVLAVGRTGCQEQGTCLLEPCCTPGLVLMSEALS